MTLELRAITEDELPAYRDAVMTTFGDDTVDDPNGPTRQRLLVDPAQTWAAFDRGAIVATAATIPLEITVPGGAALPAAGLTMVSVRPTHRRRGLSRQLIALHLADARARGHAVSALWASEAAIYGRFGYGPAAYADDLRIEQAATLSVAAGRELDDVEWADEARARASLPAIYARATAQRPGALHRHEVWWRERLFLETSFSRGGASRRRHVIARRGGEEVGYLSYRQQPSFSGGVHGGRVKIIELVGVDARAEATLWKLALGMDLFPTVTWENMPVDDALPWIVSDPRRVRRQRIDTLWLRVEDLATSLAARRYAHDGVLRFAIDATTWELVVEHGRGRCTSTSHAPALRLGRSALGSLYLGGTTATQLARADLAHGDASVIALADQLFGWPIAAWCPEVF
ncbi:MAG: GNAT family N-acetyltransferase [Myxococcota bacterium]|nr:GNAT family N-acetyltransferase [Myxococcota bacterium]